MYSNYINAILYCLIITIIIEILFSIIIGLRKKDLLNVLIVNIITNPLLNSIHPLFLFKYGVRVQIICLIILEIIAVFIEGIVYKKTLQYKKINGYMLSLLLNLLSFIIGGIIIKYII